MHGGRGGPNHDTRPRPPLAGGAQRGEGERDQAADGGLRR